MNRPVSRIDRLLEFGLIAVCTLAPLPFGSIAPAGRLALELTCFALLLVWWVAQRRRHSRSDGAAAAVVQPPLASRIALAAILVITAIQIIPLSHEWVAQISPNAERIRTTVSANGNALEAEERLLDMSTQRLDAAPTLSVEPGATATALRSGAALVALLLVSCHVAARVGVRRLMLALLISAAFQALYGLTVLATGFDQIWHLSKSAYLDSATGTWINRNHFANYLAMALPCGAALWAHRVQRAQHNSTRWFLQMFNSRGSRNLLLAGALMLGLAGLALSFSRAGIAVGFLGVTLTLWLGFRNRPLAARGLLLSIIVMLALVPLVQVGADALLNRFGRSAENFSAPGNRATVWGDTLQLSREFPLTGSGLGTFASVYPTVRSPNVRFYFAHAHNDLLQFAAEAGWVAALWMALILAQLISRIAAAMRGRHGPLAVGLAIGLSAALLHALIDFSFHLPANAATATILAGALWGLPCAKRS